jgi:hypothetical protein
MIRLRIMNWEGHVVRMGEKRCARTGFWFGDLRERDHFEELGADVRRVLKWIFNWNGEAWTKLTWLRTGTGGGLSRKLY